MTKGLQALEKIKRFEIFGTPLEHHNLFAEELNIIEKELKRLEQLEIMYSNCVIEGAKQKKALEIIKDKGIVVQFIKETNLVEQYNAVISGLLLKSLTKEEYELLKEVLENE